MKSLIAMLALVLPLPVFAAGLSYRVIGDSAVMTSKTHFSARVCFTNDPATSKTAKALVGTIGTVHAAPGRTAESGLAYTFETQTVGTTGQAPKVFAMTADADGCVQISDSISFGAYPELPVTNYRGETTGANDPIAEKTYGIRIKGSEDVLYIAHIIFNRGIKSGRIYVDAIAQK